ncbi:MAG: 2'-deoxycytidine 5'-triphosphate deaminase [Nitrospirae bacterium]|nr:2'-deoxycytidine 5'-triphosphate deaminase [Nitrospirota bacterium]
MKDGIFPVQELRQAVKNGWIAGPSLEERQFQPSSLDLRLGGKAYRVQCSFLPQDRKVEQVLPELTMYEFDLGPHAVLERGNVYLIPLQETLSLPEDVKGRTNPKSSTGRLDIFTRVITDFSARFEDIRAGYSGPLYLEVVPITFTVHVEAGLCLNQLRLFRGEPRLSDDELQRLYKKEPLLINEKGRPITITASAQHQLLPEGGASEDRAIIRRGLYMSIDLKGQKDRNIVGYKARRNSKTIDLTKVKSHNIDEYWEPVSARDKGGLILEPEEFYIFASRERVWVPPDHAAEMTEYDAGSGELRTHYAGFFDPGFGVRGKKKKKGTAAVLEVRAHDVPFRIEHGQVFFKLVYERLTASPDVVYGAAGSHYQNQGLALSKHFR